MGKSVKPKGKTKTDKDKLWENRKDYYNSIPESEINPNHKEDFETLLKAMMKPVSLKKKK